MLQGPCEARPRRRRDLEEPGEQFFHSHVLVLDALSVLHLGGVCEERLSILGGHAEANGMNVLDCPIYTSLHELENCVHIRRRITDDAHFDRETEQGGRETWKLAT